VESDEVRRILSARGFCGLSPWVDAVNPNSIIQVTLGSNFISSLEIVSALNSLNLAVNQYHYNFGNCLKKYAPKVYLGTVQTTSIQWNLDNQKGLTADPEKSGSWPQNL